MPDQLTVGGNGQNGELHVQDAANHELITVNGENGSIKLRDIEVQDAQNNRTIDFSGKGGSE
jgi:hypothetical protein